MRDIRPVRAWLCSVLACAALLASWVVGVTALSGRWAHAAHNVADVTTAFGGIFAIVAAVIYVPVFLGISALAGERLTRFAAAGAGAALAVIPCLAIALTFRESEDPHTIAQWLEYWTSHPSEFAGGLLPYAASGAIFGFVWRRGTVRRVERAPV
jgi:hypothetical protein